MYKFHFKSSPKNLVVLGCGGVGRAVCFALAKLGIENLYVIEKNKNKLNSLVNDLKKENVNVKTISLSELVVIQNEINGFLNCSELGHYNSPDNPFENITVRKNQWVFDAVYTPAKTTFIKKAEINKAKIITGIDLFLFQGIESFIIFSEKEKLRKDIMSKFSIIREYYFKKLFF